MNEWDKVRIIILIKERIHFSERSFVKEKDLKYKNVKYTNSSGKDFGSPKMNSLSELGNSIISKFIKDNEEKERLLLQKEEDIEKYKKSKHELDLNKWKYNNKFSKDFDKVKIDTVYYFKKDPKPNYLIKDPFKIPKKDGDYFEKFKSG